MIELIWNTLSWALLLTGGFCLLVGAIGLLRLPDFFTRVHAAGVTDTMGAGAILVGLMLQAGLTQASIKLILILLFMLFTSPTASHALAQAALHGGLKPRLGEQREDSRSNT